MLLPLMDKYGPTINWTLTGSLPSGMTFTRMGNATYFDSTGKLVWAPANMIGNSAGAGAAAPSTLPTNWAVETASGLTTTVVGTGTENGLPYVDINIAGTASGTEYKLRFDFGTTSAIGMSWTGSGYTKIISGASSGVGNIRFVTREIGGTYAGNDSEFVDKESSSLLRYHATRVMTTNFKAQCLYAINVVKGETINLTYRIAAPQVEPTSYNSPQAYNPTTTGAYYGPRFDHDPVTHEPLGLLMEGQRQNLLIQSAAQETWTQNNTTTTVSTELFLDGASYFRKVTNSAAVFEFARVLKGVSVTTGDVVVTSVYMKKGNTDYAVINTFDTVGHNAIFNLANGTVNTQPVGATASIQHMGNGVYRCSSTRTATATGTYITTFGPASAGNRQSNPNDYIYVLGGQCELGSSASSYIPTAGTAVTRAKDQLSFTIPSSVDTLRYVFDDNSTQDVAVSAGAYTVPTNLNRPNIKRIVSV